MPREFEQDGIPLRAAFNGLAILLLFLKIISFVSKEFIKIFVSKSLKNKEIYFLTGT